MIIILIMVIIVVVIIITTTTITFLIILLTVIIMLIIARQIERESRERCSSSPEVSPRDHPSAAELREFLSKRHSWSVQN